MASDTPRLKFELTADDMEAFFRYVAYDSEFARKQIRRRQLISSVIVVLCVGVGLYALIKLAERNGLTEVGWFALGYGVLYGLYLWVFYPTFYRRGFVRSNRRMSGLDNFKVRHVVISIEDDTLQMTGDDSSAKFDFDSFSYVSETEEHCFLGLSPVNALIIPKSQVDTDALAQICDAIRKAKAAAE